MDTRTQNGRMMRLAGGLLLTAGLALACTDTTGTAPTYTVGGTVSRLAGSGLVLRNNDGDDLAVSAEGGFTFATPLASGDAYSVTVFAQPTNPAQNCVVTGGSEMVSNANVTNVAIVCTTTYTVGGTVSGLAGSGLVLRNNDGDDLAVSAEGGFTFATPLTFGDAYSVTVFAQPTNPAQSCVVTGGSEMVSITNVTNVAIVCTTTTYTVGGTVSGLAGSGLVLVNNDGDNLLVVGNGPITFATPLSGSAAYSVRVFDQPVTPDQTCVVTGGSGFVASANITSVAIDCVTNTGPGAVRVTASTAGLDAPATDTVHFDGQSGSDSTAVVPANGAVSFDLAPGAHTVSLTVAQNCTVTSPNPVTVTVTSGATINIAFSVTCVPNGTLRVKVATTGRDVPAAYTVFVDPDPPYSAIVPANGTASFAVASGFHTVSLQVARNCTVTSSNSVPVTVAAGAPTGVAFSVTCVAPGTIQVTVATTGTNAPATYLVKATEVWYYNGHTEEVPSNGTISFHMVPGSYAVKLTVPLNCTVTSPGGGGLPVTVTVTSGATIHVAFSVTCGPPTTLRVTASTTGPNAPATFTVGVDPDFYYGFPRYSAIISSNGRVSQILPPGQHIVKLLVPLNCTVTSPNNVSVSLTSGAITHLGFTVACH